MKGGDGGESPAPQAKANLPPSRFSGASHTGGISWRKMEILVETANPLTSWWKGMSDPATNKKNKHQEQSKNK